MKPSWEDAPDGTNYLACDADGLWGWYRDEPYIDYEYREWRGNFIRPAGREDRPYPDWKDSLERRP